jgi:hypothetical protein
MAKSKKPTTVKNLAPKKVDAKKAAQVKGGGPGTQTEDEAFIGRSVRR